MSNAARPWLPAAAALIFTALPAAAQPAGSLGGPLTLEQVLGLAESRSEDLAIARAGIARTEGETIRARSGLYPQLNASASYDRALASEFEGVFGGGGGPPCDPFALNPSAGLADRVAEIERAIDCGAVGNPFAGAGGDGGFEDLPFGRENTWRLNLSFSQNLYSGGRIEAQQALAAAGRDNAALSLRSARAQLLFDVTQAFYDAALSERLVSIAEAALRQSDATARQVEALYRAGAQPEFELLRARVTRDNQTPRLIRQRANREIAMLRLKQMLDLPVDYDLQLAAPLEDVTLPPSAFAARLVEVERAFPVDLAAAPVAPSEPAERVPVQQAATRLRLTEAALEAARAQRLPNVALNMLYGRVGYPSGFLPELNRTNWSVSASLQVPILTGGRQRGDELVAQANLDETRAQLQQIGELAVVDSRSAVAELAAARATWAASAGTVQQAARAYSIAEVRFREGVSTQLELSDARLLLQQSEANRAQAARDLQIARARVALLSELPLGAGGGAAPPRQAQPERQLPAPSPAAPPAGGGGQFRNAATPGQSGLVSAGGQQ